MRSILKFLGSPLSPEDTEHSWAFSGNSDERKFPDSRSLLSIVILKPAQVISRTYQSVLFLCSDSSPKPAHSCISYLNPKILWGAADLALEPAARGVMYNIWSGLDDSSPTWHYAEPVDPTQYYTEYIGSVVGDLY